VTIGGMTIRRTIVRAGIVAALLGAGLAPATASAAPASAPVTSRVPLPAGLRPEGITSGPGFRYYVGSLADGRIVTGDLRTGPSRVLVPGVTGRSLRGLYRDDESGLLWAVGQDGPTGIVLAVDARSGRVLSRITVPGAGFLNDLVVTRSAVWVTDSAVDRLTRVPLDRHRRPAGAVSFLPLGGSWPTTGAFRANGIRALPDGSLVVDHSTAGGLWRVVPKTGAVAPIPVTGTPAVISGDGLELVGRTLYVVRGSGGSDVTVVRLRHDDGVWTARVTGLLTSPDLDVPSTATAARGRLWAVNARFGVPDPAAADYWITRLPLRASS
jgi:hypothetical protein